MHVASISIVLLAGHAWNLTKGVGRFRVEQVAGDVTRLVELGPVVDPQIVDDPPHPRYHRWRP